MAGIDNRPTKKAGERYGVWRVFPDGRARLWDGPWDDLLEAEAVAERLGERWFGTATFEVRAGFDIDRPGSPLTPGETRAPRRAPTPRTPQPMPGAEE